MDRLLGSFKGNNSGPLVVLIGGIHGNEPAGVEAIRSVLKTFQEEKFEFRGTLVGAIGNLRAMQLGRRFIDYDLNRGWSDANIDYVLRNGAKKTEDNEALELLELINSYDSGEYSRKVLADLHSTSSDRGDFIVIPEDESDNNIVKSLILPVVVDLDEFIHGTLLRYMHNRGFISFAFEGGTIGKEEASDLHVSGIWELLYASEVISSEVRNKYSNYKTLITDTDFELPGRVSVLYHHKVKPTDGFKMRPGYHNFMKINKGDILARDRNGDIKSNYDGMIFLPLYQEEGEDGFFIVKEIK